MSNTESSVSEQHEIRLEKLRELQQMGVSPYPYEFEVTYKSKQILDQPELIKKDDQDEEDAVQ
ncbi:MAG TPA: hypothetical protein VK074_09240, partial [Fodinibius sp.]|nr:hypothetical protein [Fodinibius sp.]